MTEHERQQMAERLRAMQPARTRRQPEVEPWPPLWAQLPSLDTLERIGRQDIAEQAAEAMNGR